ncbi:hypothetical protein CR513_17771, partial [Mucuna pruriens]
MIPTDNKTLKNEDPDQPSEPGEDASIEAEALADIERWIDREKQKFEAPTKDLENINLRKGIEGRKVRIGKQVPPDLRVKLIELLKEYADIFAWSYQDIPSLDCEIVEHRLPLLPGSTPIRQQLRRMRPEVALKIKEEVEKKWNAGFLVVANYPQWVANIVPVPKKDGKVRMCMDYRDLNRASPKDNFSQPHIDVLVDNIAQHAFFSLMDGFSGYNQIIMLLEDREKMTFITLWGTFCYKVIPFGLKNAGATYQRATITLFHDMMHKEIEVYVDDMIAKSKTLEQHIEDLRKLFTRLRKLNPAKCTFGVKTGKLLGFVVNENDIEVNPDKVRAIREMSVPKTKSEVRGFLGRVNFIARFISQLTATCSPIFKLLPKKQKMEWGMECQEAFDKIKRYLENPPILIPAALGRPLILYLTVLEESMGCMQGQHDATGKKEQAIYYLSKKFTDCERRYSALERTCCAFVWAAKRLRSYMLSHTTWLLAYHPLADPQPLGHEFPDEHIMVTTEDEPQYDDEWTMWFDRASHIVGNGVGVVLISPRDLCFPFAAKLGLDCTNNMAEYKACTMVLLMALEYQVRRLKVFGDSTLVIYQLCGEWETRDAKLIPYHDHVREIVTAFDAVTFHHVPREENQMADALATLSALVQMNEG